MPTDAEVYEALKYRVGVDRHGTRKYYNSAGQLHCEDGPAVVWDNGRTEWYRNGLRHRDVGPAIETNVGHKSWWQYGQLHREDGPAVVWNNGRTEWWLNGTPYTEQAYYAQLKVLGCIP